MSFINDIARGLGLEKKETPVVSEPTSSFKTSISKALNGNSNPAKPTSFMNGLFEPIDNGRYQMKTTTPMTTNFGTVDVAKSFAQGTGRSWLAMGQALSSPVKVDTKKGTIKPDLTTPFYQEPEDTFMGAFTRILTGTDQPISLAQEDKDLLGEDFGGKTGGGVSLILGTLDLLGGGGIKGVSGLTKALKAAKTVEEASVLMKTAGFADDIIGNYAPVFAVSNDAKEIKKGILAAQDLQNSTQSAFKTYGETAANAPKLTAKALVGSRYVVDDLPGEFVKISGDGEDIMLYDLDKKTTFTVNNTRVREIKPVGNGGDNLPPTKIKFADSGLSTTRERGFITTIKESPNSTPGVKAKIASNYNPLSNEETLLGAREIIQNNRDEAYNIARNERVPATAQSNAVAQLLAIEAQNAGRLNEAIELFEVTARRATKQGQAIQALSMFNRLSPEGVLRYVTKQASNYNNGVPVGKQIKVTEEFAKDIVKKAKKIEKMEDGESKAVETAKMMRDINDFFPTDWQTKIATYQTLAQLLNPKTVIRNIAGNTGFAILENVSDVVGAAIDSPLSLLTGKRSKVLPSISTQSKGFVEGLKTGIRDAIHGIDTTGTPTQFDLPKSGVFKGKVGQSAERLLNVVLKGPDRAMYKAAYDGSLYNQMKAAGVMEPTDQMIEVAHLDGLYRTFQDDNVLSKAFVGLKRALNLYQNFGIGDVILKYPKTPANILARGISYSPAGFANTLFQVAKGITGYGFDQKAFTESLSRAFVGSTALVGSGALMHRLGIITGEREKDKDIAQLQKETGLGGYKVNASALKRFVMSGFDASTTKTEKGDVLYSYDWFQPAAIGISIGANIDENNGKSGLITTIIESIANGVDTIADQPILQNLTRLLKYGDASDAIVKTAQQIPATFVPSLLNQVRQLIDDTQRSVYDPEVINYSINLAKNRVPGLSSTLEPRIGVFGDEQTVYQDGSNNVFNVFFNPAFRSVVKETPESKMVLDLFNESGESKQAPRVVSLTQKVNGENIKLSPKQVVALQRFVGTISKSIFNNLAQNPGFQSGAPEKKVNYLSNVLTDIGAAGKIIILGDRPKKVDTRTQEIMKMYLSQD